MQRPVIPGLPLLVIMHPFSLILVSHKAML